MDPVFKKQAQSDLIPFVDLTRQYAQYRYEIKLAIDRVLTSGIYAVGEEAQAFESEFAARYGAASCITISSGVKALEIGLAALGIGPGDEVVTVANAGMHSTTAIRALGAVPRFAEIDPASLTMSPEGLSAALSSRTRAVIVTHLYGRVADVISLSQLLEHYDIPLVEDCFQANGASVNGQPVGTWGVLGCFCFAPAKNLGALGEAGALITNDASLVENARRVRQNGDNLTPEAHLAWSKSSFMDEVQAAILRVKLPLLEEWNVSRRMIAQAYTIGFGDRAEEMRCPSQFNGSVYQHYVIRTRHRDLLRQNLERKGVGTAVHYPTPDYVFTQGGDGAGLGQVLPETEQACSQVLSLPCYPELNTWEVERVCELVKESLEEIRFEEV